MLGAMVTCVSSLRTGVNVPQSLCGSQSTTSGVCLHHPRCLRKGLMSFATVHVTLDGLSASGLLRSLLPSYGDYSFVQTHLNLCGFWKSKVRS